MVHIQRDGSVRVTEHWQLTFSDDPVSERSGEVDLYLALNQTAGIDFVQIDGADPGRAYLGNPAVRNPYDAMAS
jgi:hypothetical protein